MKSYKIICEDGYTTYIRAKGIEALGVSVVWDEDEIPHDVEQVRECSETELRKAWMALDRKGA